MGPRANETGEEDKGRGPKVEEHKLLLLKITEIGNIPKMDTFKGNFAWNIFLGHGKFLSMKNDNVLGNFSSMTCFLIE